jgi:hypothetical protein
MRMHRLVIGSSDFMRIHRLVKGVEICEDPSSSALVASGRDDGATLMISVNQS